MGTGEGLAGTWGDAVLENNADLQQGAGADNDVVSDRSRCGNVALDALRRRHDRTVANRCEGANGHAVQVT